MSPKKKSVGFGIASLVLSIIGLTLWLVPPLAIILSILAIIFAIVQKKINSTGISTAGLIIGIIGTVLNLVTLLIMSFFTS